MNNPSVLVVGRDPLVIRMFANAGWLIASENHSPDLFCFTGGEDVTPTLYGDVPHPRTYNNPHRDYAEQRVFEKYIGIPKVGICRGGQYLNVMSGGRMYQDVDNHALAGHHPLFYVDEFDKESIVQVTSTHHQMMDCSADGHVWGYASLSLRKERGVDRITRPIPFPEDQEIVFYEHTRSLCFQPHPEYSHTRRECTDLFFKCIERAFNLRA